MLLVAHSRQLVVLIVANCGCCLAGVKLGKQNLITWPAMLQEPTEELAKEKVRDPSDFEWPKQSRFHCRVECDTIVASICDVDFEYSYQYLGVQ